MHIPVQHVCMHLQQCAPYQPCPLFPHVLLHADSRLAVFLPMPVRQMNDTVHNFQLAVTLHLLCHQSIRIAGQVSAGARHTLAVDTQKAVFGWGLASEGQLGSNLREPALSPRRIRDLPPHPPLLYVLAAGDHSFTVGGNCSALSRGVPGLSCVRVCACACLRCSW